MRITTPIGLMLDLPPNWRDVTDDVPSENVPFTLGRAQGSGALQFSTGIHRSGPLPNISSEDLRTMLLDFAATRGLGKPSDLQTEDGPVRPAAASFRSGFFVRVWYVSDGRSVALATLTGNADAEPQELADCELMLRSIHYESNGA